MTPQRTHKSLLVFPVALFLLSLVLVSAWGPYYLGGRIDPEYFELTNAVSALTFHVPPNTDHPGTTVHVLAALVILFKWMAGVLAGNWQPIECAVFRDPEAFLHTINLVINFLVAVSIYYAGRSMYVASGSLPAALVLQLSVLLFPQTLTSLARVSPEPLLIAIGFALMVPLIRLLYSPGSYSVGDYSVQETDRSARRAGVLFGLGLVTKASIFPLGSIVLLLRSGRQKLWFCLCGAGALALFLLPSAPKFSEKLHWFVALGTHSGFYGNGSGTVPESEVIRNNVHELYQYDPSLFFLFALYCISLVAVYRWERTQPDPAKARLKMVLFSGCIGIFFGTALILMHFRAHYMIPYLIWTCFLNGMLVAHYQSSSERQKTGLCILIAGSVIGIFGILHTAQSVSWWADLMGEEREEAGAMASELRNMPQCLQMGYYLSSVPLYALHFGNEMALTQHGKALEALYPDSLSYATGEGRFYSFARRDRTDEVIRLAKQGKCVVVEGSIRARNEMVLPKAWRWDPVVVKKNQAIYALTDDSDSGRVAAKAEFLRSDAAIQGNWKGVYGRAAVAIAGDAVSWPSFSTIRMPVQNPGVWAASTSDIRGLQKAASEDRVAPHWYDASSLSFDLRFKDRQTHRLAIYCVDWDSDDRVQVIELKDARTQTVLDSRRLAKFKGGQYLVWNISGDITLSATRIAGANAVISAIFLD